MKKVSLFKQSLVSSLMLLLAACGSGGGTDSGNITGNITGQHVATFTYTLPNSEQQVIVDSRLQIFQNADNSLSGSISFIPDSNQAENCYFSGELVAEESSITGNSVRFLIPDIRPGQEADTTDEDGNVITVGSSFRATITVNAQLSGGGGTLQGTFQATQGVCGPRTGQFTSTFN